MTTRKPKSRKAESPVVSRQVETLLPPSQSGRWEYFKSSVWDHKYFWNTTFPALVLGLVVALATLLVQNHLADKAFRKQRQVLLAALNNEIITNLKALSTVNAEDEKMEKNKAPLRGWMPDETSQEILRLSLGQMSQYFDGVPSDIRFELLKQSNEVKQANESVKQLSVGMTTDYASWQASVTRERRVAENYMTDALAVLHALDGAYHKYLKQSNDVQVPNLATGKPVGFIRNPKAGD